MSKSLIPPKVAMLENLKKLLKLPPFSMEACDQFEKDLRIFDSVKIMIIYLLGGLIIILILRHSG